MRRQNWNPPAPVDESKLLSREENLKQALVLVAKLYGDATLAQLDLGECDDCGRSAPRFPFGHVAICRLCARSRRRAQR